MSSPFNFGSAGRIAAWADSVASASAAASAVLSILLLQMVIEIGEDDVAGRSDADRLAGIALGESLQGTSAADFDEVADVLAGAQVADRRLPHHRAMDLFGEQDAKTVGIALALTADAAVV